MSRQAVAAHLFWAIVAWLTLALAVVVAAYVAQDNGPAPAEPPVSTSAVPGARYWAIPGDVKQARRACERAGQPDVVYGDRYATWYRGLSSTERTHWQAVFDRCQAEHPVDRWVEVTEDEFYR